MTNTTRAMDVERRVPHVADPVGDLSERLVDALNAAYGVHAGHRAAHAKGVACAAAISAPIPASYAQLAYHAIHAFKFVAPDGTVRPVRYHFIPAAGEASISDDDAAARPEHYLRDELEQRLASGPAIFYVDLELAAEGDPIDDPTAIWPDDRERVRVGELTIAAL